MTTTVASKNKPDPVARKQMAELMRRFASGALTVDEFEEVAEKLLGDDRAIWNSYVFCWSHYDDFRTKRLIGPYKLSPESRKIWARWILYLYSNTEPYGWENLSIGCGTFAWGARLVERVVRGKSEAGRNGAEEPFWPFASERALQLAKSGKTLFG